MKKAPLILGVAVALAFAGAALWYRNWQRAEAPAERAAPPAGPQTAPPFSLVDLKGNPVSSEAFRGRPTVINFFATWCPPCQQEIPGFVEVYKKYRAQGFALVGIALDTDTRGKLASFVSERGIEYPVLLGDVETARAYGGVSSIPTTFFVGKNGEIRNVHVGYMDKDAFDAEVRKLF